MAIDFGQAKHIARLSRLRFREQELEKFTKELSRIIDHVDKLKEVKDAKQKIGLPQACRLREDTPGDPLSRKWALLNAPKQEKGYFVTPKVL